MKGKIVSETLAVIRSSGKVFTPTGGRTFHAYWLHTKVNITAAGWCYFENGSKITVEENGEIIDLNAWERGTPSAPYSNDTEPKKPLWKFW